MQASETQRRDGNGRQDSDEIKIIRKLNILAPSHAVLVAVCMEHRIKKGRQWLKLLHNPQNRQPAQPSRCPWRSKWNLVGNISFLSLHDLPGSDLFSLPEC